MTSIAVRRAFGRLICVCAVAFAACAPAAAQEHSAKGVGGALFIVQSPAIAQSKDCCLGDPDLKITIGEQAKGTVYFTCKDANGNYLKDHVDISIFGEPRRHGEAAPVVKPPQSDTYPFNSNGSSILIDTVYKKDKPDDTTTPRNYTISAGGTSTNKNPPCTSYPVISAPLAVAPKIVVTENDKKFTIEDVWWFNGEHPKNYDTMLSAQPPDQASYDWKVVDGTDYGKVGTTTDNKALIVGIKAPKPDADIAPPPQSSGKPTVDVTVKVGGVTSDPHKMLVRMPYRLQYYACPRPPCTIPDRTYGYASFIGYHALDQHDQPLPHVPVPWNERINHDFTYDPPWNKNCPAAGSPPCWRPSTACANPLTGSTVCGQSDPNTMVDWIGGEGVRAGFVPEPQPPGKTLGNTKVDHSSGGFFIGSIKQGDGIEVQRHWWQKYRDHGCHTHVQSPPGKTPKNPPPC